MATVKHNQHVDFYESIPEFVWNILLGLTSIAGIWLLIGVVKMFLLLK